MSDERIGLVTGASRGLGRAVAKTLALNGWRVVCVARSQKALEKLDDEIRDAGAGSAVLVPFDLKDLDSIDQLAASLFERYGRLDGLCYCAGVLGALTPMSQASARVMNETFTINVQAPQRFLHAFHPLLKASDAGRAAFVTCEAAIAPKAYWGPYAASKAALETMINAYAAECAVTEICANLFDPGVMRTGLRAKAFPGEEPSSQTPPEDVAPSLAALLAPSCTLRGARIRFGDEGA